MSSSSSLKGRSSRKTAGNVSIASTSARPASKKSQRPTDLNSRLLDASMTTTPFSAPKKRGRPSGSTAKRASNTSTSAASTRILDTPSTSTAPATAKSKAGGKKKGPSILTRAAAPPAPKTIPTGRYQPPTKAKAATAARPTPSRPAPVRKAPSTAAEDSDVSLVDGVSEAEDEDEDEDLSGGDASDMSDAEQGAKRAKTSSKTTKRKGWPAERERLRKWRKLSVQERECISSEGGLVWRTAIPLLNSMPKNIRSMVADSLTKALNRIDARLETGLVPPLARMPLGTATRRELPSSMLSWRLEEEGSLLHAEAGSSAALQLGMNAETSELEQMLLPEAEQIIELNKTLESQSRQLQRATNQIADLKKERRLAKAKDSSQYPGNLKAHDLLSVTAQKPQVDAALSSFFRFHAI